METLQIIKANVVKAHDEGTPKVKTLLENMFGKKVFAKSPMDLFKTWEDVCEANDTDPINSLPFPSPKTTHQEAVNGFFKMTLIADALNEGWIPDWDNTSEYKYSPWFKHSGGGFSFYGCDFDYTLSSVGARLVFKSRELAEYAGKQFLDIYKSFHTR